MLPHQQGILEIQKLAEVLIHKPKAREHLFIEGQAFSTSY
jgi:hypothetical protein